MTINVTSAGKLIVEIITIHRGDKVDLVAHSGPYVLGRTVKTDKVTDEFDVLNLFFRQRSKWKRID